MASWQAVTLSREGEGGEPVRMERGFERSNELEAERYFPASALQEVVEELDRRRDADDTLHDLAVKCGSPESYFTGSSAANLLAADLLRSLLDSVATQEEKRCTGCGCRFDDRGRCGCPVHTGGG